MKTLDKFRHDQDKEEAAYLRDSLKACGWKIEPTAILMGCSPANVRRLLAAHPDVDAVRRSRRSEDGDGLAGRPVKT